MYRAVLKSCENDKNRRSQCFSGPSRRTATAIVVFLLSCLLIWPYIYLQMDYSISDGNDLVDVKDEWMGVPRPRKRNSKTTKGVDGVASVHNSIEPKRKKNIARVNATSSRQRVNGNYKNERKKSATVKDQDIMNQNRTAANALTINKPWFVLHIGPQKTATTTIQSGLDKHSQLLAQEDRYYYLGQGASLDHHPRRSMPNGEKPFWNRFLIQYMSYLERADENSREHFEEFKQRLEWHRGQGHHVVLSSELYGSRMNTEYHHVWKGLKDVLSGFNVRVVLAYRHFMDWIPSNYYQKSVKNGANFTSLLDWIEDHLDSWDKVREQYYSQQRKQSKRHKQGLGNNNDDDDDDNVESSGLNSESHITLWLFQKWSRHFDDIRVFDMHQDGYLDENNANYRSNSTKSSSYDLRTKFICQMLPTADKTCQILRFQQQIRNKKEVGTNGSTDALDGKDVTENKNKLRTSADLYTERVMEAALEKGLIDQKHWQIGKRQRPLSILRNLLVDEGVLPPISSSRTAMPPQKYFDCISPSLEERLLKTSLYFMERVYNTTRLTGSDASGQPMILSGAEWETARAKHDRLFAKNKAEGKYCDVNPQRVLDDPRLRSLISGLTIDSGE